MKIAYFSPLNPIKSGISDFSEELLIRLKEYSEIDLFTDNYLPSSPSINENFSVFSIADYAKEDLRRQYDAAVFHVGNNLDFHKNIVETFMKYGGILELHDISLHDFMAGYTLERKNCQEYLRLMTYCHGQKGKNAAEKYFEGKILAPWVTHPLEFTMNKHLIDHAQAVIVHSDFAKQIIKAVAPKKKVVCIPHHTSDIMDEYATYYKACREKLGILTEDFVLGSFGYATESKRILQVLEALSKIKKSYNGKFLYYIVGEVSGINVDNKIHDLGLEENVIITGFTSLDEFKIYIGACDVCINLRYPTHGESSGSLHRMLGMGKTVIVTKIGTFDEYPDDIVIKVRYDEHEVEDIYDAVCKLTQNRDEFQRRQDKVLSFARNYCDLEKNSQKYTTFFNAVKNDNYQDDYLDRLIDKIFELNLTDDEYLEHILNKVKN